MNPITSSFSSSSSGLPINFNTEESITCALKYLQEHKHEIASLSEKDFTILQSHEKISNLFQEVFGVSQKTCSYDQILKLRLEHWAKLSEDNQRAKKWILAFLQDSSQKELNLSSYSLTHLPDIWQHSAFTSRLQTLNLGNNQLTVLPDSIGHLLQLQMLELSSNRLTILPNSIDKLVNLQGLYLSNNRLTILADWISNLLQL